MGLAPVFALPCTRNDLGMTEIGRTRTGRFQRSLVESRRAGIRAPLIIKV